MTPPTPLPSRARRRRTRIAGAAVAVLALIGAAFFVGPRNTFGPDTATPRAAPEARLEALDGWLAASEARWGDIRPGLQKGIVWHSPAHQRTPWAVVYLHGFSASRAETAPLAEQVAQQLGANLFYTRLTGHGRTGPALGEARVQDWLADTLEAVRIGQTLGERVLVIGVSTGATLASWLALQPQGAQVAAYAFISPNFGLRNKRSEIINVPWGRQIALALEGETRGTVPPDPREAHAWTNRYPTRALFPMMALVKHVRDSALARFRTPVLMLYSESDQTADPAETRAAFARIGSAQKKLQVVDYSESQGQHVLAGDILAPKATGPMAHTIAAWVRALP
ncbi:MAG: alpha/beta fold hydrolase [Burkholderiaceae bacterium]